MEVSILENYILDICASEPGVADHWKYLFRKWKSAKGFAKSWKPKLFAYGTQNHDVHSRYPAYHAVDCTDVDCRSRNCTREGREIFKRGGQSCHLQAHIVNQWATVRAVESAMDAVIAGHQTIGFFVTHVACFRNFVYARQAYIYTDYVAMFVSDCIFLLSWLRSKRHRYNAWP